ncbi:MAG: DEAD/DEAH box helicase, partial [Candidatus Heimdallarchaeaceae archaeon]
MKFTNLFIREKYHKISYTIEDNAVKFELIDYKGNKILVDDWDTILEKYTLDVASEVVYSVLTQLIEQQFAEEEQSSIAIFYDHIHQIPQLDLEALGLPDLYPYSIEVHSYGTLGEESFIYRVFYVDGVGREFIGTNRIGPFLKISSKRIYFLNENLYSLIEAIETFNSRNQSEKSFSKNLLEFSKIKGLAETAGAKLDQYLNNENVVVPKAIQIKLHRIDNETLEIIPIINNIDENKFIEKFDRQSKVKDVYHFDSKSGSRQRLVLDKLHKEALYEVKTNRVLSGNQKAAFLTAPKEFLHSEAFNLDDFSDRVKEIGEYKVRFYPFIRTEKENWLPPVVGLRIESDDENIDIQEIPIKSIEALNELEKQFKEAERENKKSFVFRGHKFPIDDSTQEKIAQLRKVLEEIESQESVKAKDIVKDKNFLIIYENIEEEEYVEPQKEQIEYYTMQIPQKLKDEVTLFAYQRQGIGWLQNIRKNNYRGGLLADDMGLGKTLQVLTFLSWYFEVYSTKKPALIIAPVALLDTWIKEYIKFFNVSMGNVLQLYGENLLRFKLDPNTPRREYKQKIVQPTLDVEGIKEYRIVLTNYETVRDYQFSMGIINWGVVIADEAQKIKTPSTLITNAVKALKTDFSIANTATPVENSLVDLWCIIDFVYPGYLGSLKRFTTKYVTPLRKNVAIESLSEELRVELKNILMRRMKEDILEELPRKEEYYEEIEMNKEQLERYIQEIQVGFEAKINHKNPGHIILQILSNLKAICAHPILPEYSEGMYSAEELIEASTKLKKLLIILSEIEKKEEKAIIFEESRKMQRVLKRVLYHKLSRNITIINGKVPGVVSPRSRKESRQQLIEKFERQNGFNVIIMSPKATGLGLTITEANHVIHYSRVWNPAKEDQATDRVYRIGQKRNVHVYY